MTQETPDPTIETLADGTPVRSEDIGFSAAELVACDSCSRMNPPDRLKCMYCGGELRVRPEYAGQVKTNFRKLEDWENGFNVVAQPLALVDGDRAAKIGNIVGLEPFEVTELFAAGGPMPVGRFESLEESDLVATTLTSGGLDAVILKDTDLAVDTSPVRLRAMEFSEGYVTLVNFNGNDRRAISLDDIVLLVTGTIGQTRNDQIEKRKKKGETLVLDEFETSSDETVLDIYSREETIGYRVITTGFDFSCLGADKDILAVKNMQRLIAHLSELAHGAKLVTNYQVIRHALAAVWDVDRRKDFEGMKRSGFGKFNLGTSASTSNLRQFNKYSRMHRHLV